MKSSKDTITSKTSASAQSTCKLHLRICINSRQGSRRSYSDINQSLADGWSRGMLTLHKPLIPVAQSNLAKKVTDGDSLKQKQAALVTKIVKDFQGDLVDYSHFLILVSHLYFYHWSLTFLRMMTMKESICFGGSTTGILHGPMAPTK